MVSLGYALLNSSAFQNYICNKSTSWLSAQFNTNISIGSITYNPFSSFSLTQVYFGDQRNDTLFYAGKVTFNLGHFNTDSLFFELKNVKVEQGLCKLTTYKDGYFSIDVILDFVNKDTSVSHGPKFHLLLSDVLCTNTRFILNDDNFSKEPLGFDPFHEVFSDITLEAKNFHIVEDSLNLLMTHLEANEKSGLRVENLSNHAIITSKGMFFSELKLKTPFSRLENNGNRFNIHYDRYVQLAEFIDSVKLSASLKEGLVDMRDIAFFAPSIQGMNQQFKVQADFSGTVADFQVKNMFITYGEKSRLIGRVSITGLPDYQNAFVDGEITEARTSTNDISYLSGVKMPEQMNRLGLMKFTGDFTGFFRDFVAYGNFETDMGKIQTDINMKLPDDEMETEYSGNLNLLKFNLGKLTGFNTLGETSLSLNVDGKGFDPEKIEADFKSTISEIYFNRYTYHGININGNLDKKMFQGNLDVNDSNLELSFGGLVDFNREIPLYKFTSEIKRAFLQPLHFDTAETIVSADLKIDFSAKDIDHHRGKITLSDVNCVKNGRDFSINNAVLSSDFKDNVHDIEFKSDDIDATLHGDLTLSTLGSSFHKITSVIFPAYIQPPSDKLSSQNLTYSLSIRNTKVINALLPIEYTCNNLALNGALNLAENKLIMNISADQVGFGNYKVKELTGQLNTTNHAGYFELTAAEFLQYDTLFFRGFDIKSAASLNKLISSLKINDTITHIRSDLRTTSLFMNDGVHIHIDTSDMEYYQIPFQFTEGSELIASIEQVDFKNVQIRSKTQEIILSGFYDFAGDHQLKATLDSIDLSNINTFYKSSNIRFGGFTNGELVLKGASGITYVDAYLKVTALKFDNDKIGDFSITTNYNQKQNRFLVYAKSLNGKLKNLEFGGYIETDEKPFNVNMSVAFDESPLNSFQAFLKDQLFIHEGYVSAECKLVGPLDNLALTGQVYLNKVRARVEYLKTMYSFETVLMLEKDKMLISSTRLIDINGREAFFEGKVTHRSFSNFNLDIKLKDMNRFKVLGTTARDNNMYYGTAFASGNLSIRGPVSDLVMDAKLKTERGTQFNIPISNSTDAENQLLRFINTDTLKKVTEVTAINKLYGFSMNVMLEITPDAEIQIIMDPVTEDRIRGTGTGTMKMELTRQGQFNMYGGVTIEEGDYNFTLKPWSRKFLLKRGGTILWSGDPLQAVLDVSGIYRPRKTSIADLLPYADDAVRSKRVPVECLLYVKGNLLSPEFKFDLNFPDITSNLSAENVSLENSLNTLRSNPDMMNQQVISLMVFNNFVPMNSAANGNKNINDGVSNTLSDLVSRQINKGVEKLIPGLDFNIDMQYSTLQRPQYNLSMTRKLLDDRLEVQFTYDVINYNNNFMTQYNIRKDGSLKLRAYNKTSTSTDPTYYRNITTQGLGLYYRKEFDHFSDLFKKRQPAKESSNKTN